jgi:hypothetical protein
MRSAIFSSGERDILSKFLEADDRSEGYSALRHKMHLYKESILSDVLLWHRTDVKLQPMYEKYLPVLEEMLELAIVESESNDEGSPEH